MELKSLATYLTRGTRSNAGLSADGPDPASEDVEPLRQEPDRTFLMW